MEKNNTTFNLDRIIIPTRSFTNSVFPGPLNCTYQGGMGMGPGYAKIGRGYYLSRHKNCIYC